MSKVHKEGLIDTEQKVQKTPEETYTIIKNWLIKKEAKILDENAPNMIKIKHGKRWIWKSNILNLEKNLTILINGNDEQTFVRVVLDIPWYDKTPYTMKLLQRKYYNWASDLWTELGVEPEQRLQDDLYGAEALFKEQIDASKTMYVSLIALLGGIAVIIWAGLNGNDSYISTMLVTSGTIGTIYSWNNVQDAKRLMKKSDPEKLAKFEQMKTQSNPVKSFKNLTLVVLICVFVFGVWAYKQPEVLVYSGDGYTFEYPRSFKATLNHDERLPEDDFEYVQCEYEDSLIIVYCVSLPHDSDTEVLLNSMLNGYVVTYSGVITDRNSRELNGNKLYQANFDFNIGGVEYKSKYGAFYDKEQNRAYIISYITDGFNVERQYQQIIESFNTT